MECPEIRVSGEKRTKTEDTKKVGDIKFYSFKENIWAIKMR